MPARICLDPQDYSETPDAGDAVLIAHPSRWGNPFSGLDAMSTYPSLTDHQVSGMIVNQLRDVIRAGGRLFIPNFRRIGGHRGPATFTYPTVDEITAALAGRDLACWCALDEPCHGDVLLSVANGGPI